MSINDNLLQAIRSRGQKNTPFDFGILTADRHVANLRDRIGSDACYRYATPAGKSSSFNDILEKAAKTLVYSNEEMIVDRIGEKVVGLPMDVQLPKNTLMVFRHVLTTSTKDRDGDVLHPDGADVDPKMLLLWQHVHTLPIGKLIQIVEQNKKKLVNISVIVDMNELCHDAAVMIDNDMGRFSHGFRALEFTEDKGSGFDVTKFEIMEQSLVSVPANKDAGTEEILVSLVERGKLTSPIMKEMGKQIREAMPVMVPVKLDVTLSLNGKEVTDANQSADRSTTERVKDIVTPSKETDGEGIERKEETKDADAEVKDNLSWRDIVDELPIIKQCLIDKGIGIEKKDTVWLSAIHPDYIVVHVHIEKSDRSRVDSTCKVGDGGHFMIEYTMTNGKCRLTGVPERVYELRTRSQNTKVKVGVTGETDDHTHTVRLDEDGNGTTNNVDDHAHDIVDFEIQEADGHTHTLEADDLVERGTSEGTIEKAGRSISKANENRIRNAHESVDEAIGMDGTPRPVKAMLREASKDLGVVLGSLGLDDDKSIMTREAISHVLAFADTAERKGMLSILKSMEEIDIENDKAKQLRSILGR